MTMEPPYIARYQDGAEIFEQLKTREAALDVPAYTVAMHRGRKWKMKL